MKKLILSAMLLGSSLFATPSYGDKGIEYSASLGLQWEEPEKILNSKLCKDPGFKLEVNMQKHLLSFFADLSYGLNLSYAMNKYDCLKIEGAHINASGSKKKLETKCLLLVDSPEMYKQSFVHLEVAAGLQHSRERWKLETIQWNGESYSFNAVTGKALEPLICYKIGIGSHHDYLKNLTFTFGHSFVHGMPLESSLNVSYLFSF